MDDRERQRQPEPPEEQAAAQQEEHTLLPGLPDPMGIWERTKYVAGTALTVGGLAEFIGFGGLSVLLGAAGGVAGFVLSDEMRAFLLDHTPAPTRARHSRQSRLHWWLTGETLPDPEPDEDAQQEQQEQEGDEQEEEQQEQGQEQEEEDEPPQGVSPRRRRAPEQQGRRARVFCASLADVFEPHPQVAEARARLWDLIEATPALDWQLLTKRPKFIGQLVPQSWRHSWPSHVWIGVSVGTQQAAEKRLPYLLEVPAPTRFLSCGAIRLV